MSTSEQPEAQPNTGVAVTSLGDLYAQGSQPTSSPIPDSLDQQIRQQRAQAESELLTELIEKKS